MSKFAFFVFMTFGLNAFAEPQTLICTNMGRGIRVQFEATLARMLPSTHPNLKYQGSITGNSDASPGNFDRIFSRAEIQAGRDLIRIESRDRNSSGESIFIAEITTKTMQGFVFTDDTTRGGALAIPKDLKRDGTPVMCFWRSHPGCNCGGPGIGQCTSGNASACGVK